MRYTEFNTLLPSSPWGLDIVMVAVADFATVDRRELMRTASVLIAVSAATFLSIIIMDLFSL